MSEISAIIARIHVLADKLEKATAEPSAEHGKVVWSHKRDEFDHVVLPDRIGPSDALATLYDLATCEITLAFRGRQLLVTLQGEQSYPGSPGCYERKPLRELLEEELQRYKNDADCKDARLLARLVQAFEEP